MPSVGTGSGMTTDDSDRESFEQLLARLIDEQNTTEHHITEIRRRALYIGTYYKATVAQDIDEQSALELTAIWSDQTFNTYRGESEEE